MGSWSGLDISGGVIEHWDGTAWTEVPFQGPGGQFSGFTGVAAVSSEGTVSAVGAGKAKITVKYGDKVIVVQVVVTHNPALPSTLTSKERL